MEKKFTPGTWRFYTEPQPNGCPIIGNDKGLMVAMLANSVNYADQKQEAIANAQLISAAPELLETLQKALNSNWTDSDWIAGANAAVAKALGEKQ